jgi:hypothetical protein
VARAFFSETRVESRTESASRSVTSDEWLVVSSECLAEVGYISGVGTAVQGDHWGVTNPFPSGVEKFDCGGAPARGYGVHCGIRTPQPRSWGAPRKHIADGPKGLRSGKQARQRSSLQGGLIWRAGLCLARASPSCFQPVGLRAGLDSHLSTGSGSLVSRAHRQPQRSFQKITPSIASSPTTSNSLQLRSSLPCQELIPDPSKSNDPSQ